ncbi:MAG: glutamate racemase, partial [Eggerthellaceae bacterium]|nr:glutamate racemase [Eggerthellaceae bacterium]
CSWLQTKGVKLILIACNTATAAGLSHAQETMNVPVLGVVEPGARAAVMVTRNRRVGVIATKGTIESGAYSEAIRHIDAGVTVFSVATPKFVDIVEQGVRLEAGPLNGNAFQLSKTYIRPEFEQIARDYLEPLRRCEIDTLVLGCTHFPLLKPLIGSVIGQEVKLISSAAEAARDVAEVLERKQAFARPTHAAQYYFYTSGDNVEEFKAFGSCVLGVSMQHVEHVDF